MIFATTNTPAHAEPWQDSTDLADAFKSAQEFIDAVRRNRGQLAKELRDARSFYGGRKFIGRKYRELCRQQFSAMYLIHLRPEALDLAADKLEGCSTLFDSRHHSERMRGMACGDDDAYMERVRDGKRYYFDLRYAAAILRAQR